MKNALLLFACILSLFACQSEPKIKISDVETGTIKGDSVVMLRGGEWTEPEVIGMFNNNEVVTIMNKDYSMIEPNAGVVIIPISLFTDRSYKKEAGFTLPIGTSVIFDSYEEGSGDIHISYQHPEKGRLYAQSSNYQIKVESHPWFQVKRSSGETGWVFGKFLTLN